MGDDAATVEQLRDLYAAGQAEIEAQRQSLALADARETALADVLRVIASSPTDLQTILDTLAESAARLSGADRVVMHRLVDDALWPSAAFGAPNVIGFEPHVGQRAYGTPVDQGTASGRAICERRTLAVDDVAALSPNEFPGSSALQAVSGARSAVFVPLLSRGEPIGSLHANRMAVRPFTEQQVRLLEAFADQAVIAIENARLFEELEQRNRELQASNRQVTEALVLTHGGSSGMA
jgi:GAF domain-containing protein